MSHAAARSTPHNCCCASSRHGGYYCTMTRATYYVLCAWHESTCLADMTH